MARAYFVLNRNDLSSTLLQVLDLYPNATPSVGSRVYGGKPQGGYFPHFADDGVNGDVSTTGVGPILSDGDTYGLSAYLIDRVENSGAGGDPALTAAEANAITASIYGRVSSGLSLELSDINTLINTPAGVSGSDLDGTLGNSTGSVEDILKILSGLRYKLSDDSQVEDGANAFDTTIRGFFVERPNYLLPSNVVSSYTGASVRGRGTGLPPSHLRPGESREEPVQSGNQDVNFKDIRLVLDTGKLHLSADSGMISTLKSSTFSHNNTTFSYGAGGTAKTLDGTAIPTTTEARAVTLYAANGSLI